MQADTGPLTVPMGIDLVISFGASSPSVGLAAG